MTIAGMALLWSIAVAAQRKEISLDKDWQTALVPIQEWKKVNVPHNWDDYYGYRRLVHGNLHGEAVYTKEVRINETKTGKRFFLFFEGVGSYATVFLNKEKAGEHAGGRTSFTIDITSLLKTDGKPNLLEIKVAHPSGIRDLPWVCGACSEERGFSEGSQPFGIFRPVQLLVTSDIRVEPFGVHAWATIQKDSTRLFINTTLKNYSANKRAVRIVQELRDQNGKKVAGYAVPRQLNKEQSASEISSSFRVSNPVLWSVENPYLYQIITRVEENGKLLDRTVTDFGFRTIEWSKTSQQFLLNGKPVFINGIAEYEHLLGQSHAFSDAQVKARMNWVQSAGFNAFRDGHQPHNLRYGKLCNEKGILWWTQLSAHVWYDTKEFRENFKQLLKEWVIERRNDPSVILWGLQNESQLPKAFAEECTALIRSLDPTASSQRLVTTCNGGEGTDWDVPQNWTGTYGGDPATYAEDLKKQVLVGEYGAWRTIDLHTEGAFVTAGPYSEDRMTALMEQKLRLAETVRDSVAGHFFWLLTSHDNPGRVQGGEGLRELDRVGPVNYKGLLTPWEEPTDAYYMFRSHYAPAATDPMVYIASHTWPNRWTGPGKKNGIIIYSNCEEVELFNDMGAHSLGRKKNPGRGRHFQWDQADIRFNILYAVGYVNGKAVTTDTLVLFHLPPAPHFSALTKGSKNFTKGVAGKNYLYRVNCGGPALTDENGNQWEADKTYARSWADEFPGTNPAFASQRRIFTPVKNSRDWKLFQSFRYGREKLSYEFPVTNGSYEVELFFIEPWLGNAVSSDSRGMRIFDVAVNGNTVLDDLDIFKEAGSRSVLKKIIPVQVRQGKIVISFPEIKAGQALISAIAIADTKPVSLRQEQHTMANFSHWESWMDMGDTVYAGGKTVFHTLPAVLYGADWIRNKNRSQPVGASWESEEPIYLYVAVPRTMNKPGELTDFETVPDSLITDEAGGKVYQVYRKLFAVKGKTIVQFPAGIILAKQPAGNMQPAYDLKPVVQFRTNVVKPGAGTSKDSVNGRYCIKVNTAQPARVDYPVQTGLGDRYSFTVKYFYGKENNITGRVQLLDAGGSMMMDEEVNFSFTRAGKWNQFTLNTPGMINAGNYILRIIVDGGEGLAVSGVDLQ